MKNELAVFIDCEDWFYFTTEKSTIDEAIHDLYERLDEIGVNFDNMIFMRAALRDKDGNTIEEEELL